MTSDEFVEAIAKLDWWPGSIEMEMQLHGMTRTPTYKERAALRVVQESKAWVLRYEAFKDDKIAGATRREREFYEVITRLLKELTG